MVDHAIRVEGRLIFGSRTWGVAIGKYRGMEGIGSLVSVVIECIGWIGDVELGLRLGARGLQGERDCCVEITRRRDGRRHFISSD